MKILGIDPGSHVTGYGFIDMQGSKFQFIAAGILRAPETALPLRLLSIANELEVLLQLHKPDAVSIEMIFHAYNSQSAIVLGQARGALLLCIARLGLPIFEYSALQIKQALTGRGRAEKTQVQHMIRMLLKINETMPLDASDALAAAICHAQMHMTSLGALIAKRKRA